MGRSSLARQHNHTHPKQHNFIHIKCFNMKITYIAFQLIFTVQVIKYWHKDVVGLPPSEATWTWAWAPCSLWLCWSRGWVKGTQRSLPNPTILKFCEIPREIVIFMILRYSRQLHRAAWYKKIWEIYILLGYQSPFGDRAEYFPASKMALIRTCAIELRLNL